jgi:Domain of unknown function (DUF4304)
VGGYAPRARKDSVRPRRLMGASGRPLNFTVRHSVSTPRELMDASIKANVVPFLRRRGYTGSFPHFRCLLPDRIDLLTFQFDRHGGGFVVEMGSCDVDGITLHWGKHVPPSKVTAWDLHPSKRRRLKPPETPGRDYWFRFEAGDYDAVARRVTECLTSVRGDRER